MRAGLQREAIGTNLLMEAVKKKMDQRQLPSPNRDKDDIESDSWDDGDAWDEAEKEAVRQATEDAIVKTTDPEISKAAKKKVVALLAWQLSMMAGGKDLPDNDWTDEDIGIYVKDFAKVDGEWLLLADAKKKVQETMEANRKKQAIDVARDILRGKEFRNKLKLLKQLEDGADNSDSEYDWSSDSDVGRFLGKHLKRLVY